MKVLIVDDNGNDRKLLHLTFKRHGWGPVIEAGDGQEGFDLAREHRPDLIISDAMMPKVDGFRFLRLIKTSEELKEIPFVFHSAVYTGSRDEELALSLGAEAFIPKPMAPEDFWRELTLVMQGLEPGKKRTLAPSLPDAEEEYLRKYSGVVAAKLEEKVKELERALVRRKVAEEALRTQFVQFSRIFDALNALVFVADLENGDLLFLNRYGATLFEEDWRGRKCHEIFVGPNDAADDKGLAELLVKNGVPQPPLVWEFRCPLNHRWYQGIDRAIPWTDGRLVRLEIAFDITDQKELGRIKDEMISAVSHGMRTPLTALMGYTEYMLTNELSLVQMKEYLKIVQGETEKLNELIGNFLDLQRQKARAGAGDLQPLDLAPLLEEVANHYRRFTKTHRIIVEAPDFLGPVQGDKKLLRRMFELLLSNAIKFSPSGGDIFLRAARDTDRIRIEVQDQGIGIPEDFLEHIFEPFFRVDNTDRRKFGGAGLGLALVREIVIGHGGQIWAKSSLGQGSTFFVALPVLTDRMTQSD